MRIVASVIAAALLASCGSLEKKSIMVSPGDGKEQVLAAMGPPDDRQFRGDAEAWQYCQTGAGFGYHDYRIVWIRAGKVIGLTSYKSGRPASSCVTDIRQVRWEDAPDYRLEIRSR